MIAQADIFTHVLRGQTEADAASGIMFDFSREYLQLKPAMLMSLLTVWVLVGLFAYLNRYTRRHYFTIWTAAWLFYALWLTIGISSPQVDAGPWVALTKQWCVGASGIFMLWGGLRFLELRTPQRLFGLFMLFILVWSYVGADYVSNPLLISGPVFVLLGLSSAVNAGCFFRLRHRRPYVGAGLLAVGFLLWGIYLAAFPFFPLMGEWVAMGFFSSAVLQLFIAVSMIILVLEEARASKEQAVRQAESHKSEAENLRTQVVSTEERYRNLFDQASEGIIITTADDLRIVEMNQTARRLFGLWESDVAKHHLPSFCQFKTDRSAAIASNSAEWFSLLRQQPRLTLVRRNGGGVSVEIDGAPIQFAGRPAYQFFVRELTGRAQLEQQLRQAEKLSALGRMISGVAHELNNPLAIIKGYLDLILKLHTVDPATRADLEKVAHESNRAAKLVSNFLSFAREQSVKRQAVNLNKIIARVVDLRKFDARAAGANIVLRLGSDLPETQADADQIHQVLVNLINNALHAVSGIKRPGCVKISTQAKGGRILVLVEDNGPGVPDDVLPRIFEPFFTTKDIGAGTGLGLSIAHSIMTDHGGRVIYQPSSEGGAGFILEFPIVEVASNSLSKPVVLSGNNSAGLSAPKARILVLDDEKSLAELLGEMLGLLGHSPTVCYSPVQALGLLEKDAYDLVLSDFRMPGMDGRQFYEAATQKHPDLAKRIIFLTGDVVTPETKEFLKAVGNPHLPKPFHLDNVEQAVSEVLSGMAAAA